MTYLQNPFIPTSEPSTVGSWRDDAEYVPAPATDLPTELVELFRSRDLIRGDDAQEAPVHLADGTVIHPAFLSKRNAWTFKGEDWVG
jgi:hypothetical protein